MREATGLTRDDVAERMDCDASKIMRFETGRWKRIQPRDLRDLLDIYGVTDTSQRDAYQRMAKEARELPWWREYADILKGAYVGFEEEASSIHSFEAAYIPGLFQTEDYARALFRAAPLVGSGEVERRVKVRMERKSLLERDDVQGLWVLDEAAIRRTIGGPEVMASQLQHLLRTASDHPGVSLQVLPFDAGAHAGMDGSFVVLAFPEPADRPVVYVETPTEALYPDREDALRQHMVIFNHLQMMALSLEASADLIERRVVKLQGGTN